MCKKTSEVTTERFYFEVTFNNYGHTLSGDVETNTNKTRIVIHVH